VRVEALSGDVVVVTSRLWQTTAAAIRSGDEAMAIDSPYFPDELELWPSLLSQAGFDPAALLATHADFDHLLGRFAYPRLALGVGEETAARLRAEPGAAQRELRDSDGRLYVTRRAPLSLGSYQVLPVPGKLEIGSAEVELHPAPGHTADGTAFLFGGVLFAGDYVSDVELPVIAAGGSLAEYRLTLARYDRLLERVDTVVPGHGSIHDREAARRLLDEDVDYLDALERGDERPRLPDGRDDARQRELHAANLAAVSPT
jgi:glyoxylase-like metal-dependent hydrolase (beta-lactamase superfamily II)